MKRGLIGLILILVISRAADAVILAPDEALDHLGETATVCGPVASGRYAPELRGEPTFLDLDHAYPNANFTIVIFGKNRSMLGTLESLVGHRICVSGRIQLFRAKPQVILEIPAQLME